MIIQKGDSIAVHYTGKLADGTEFDSSISSDPLEFVVGDGSLIAGFDEAVIGKKVGDKVQVVIEPEKAYGHSDPSLLFSIPKSDLPEDLEPEVGMFLQINTEHGDLEIPIVEVNEEDITVDANHPMAGKELHFSIEIVEKK